MFGWFISFYNAELEEFFTWKLLQEFVSLHKLIIASSLVLVVSSFGNSFIYRCFIFFFFFFFFGCQLLSFGLPFFFAYWLNVENFLLKVFQQFWRVYDQRLRMVGDFIIRFLVYVIQQYSFISPPLLFRLFLLFHYDFYLCCSFLFFFEWRFLKLNIVFFWMMPGCFLDMHTQHLNVSNLWRRTTWILKKLDSGVNIGKSPYVHSTQQTWSSFLCWNWFYSRSPQKV